MQAILVVKNLSAGANPWNYSHGHEHFIIILYSTPYNEVVEDNND